MDANSFGNILRFSSSGESHGTAYTGVLKGFPAGISIDYPFLAKQLEKRKAKLFFETARKEEDKVLFLSGIKNHISDGTDIVFRIENKAFRSTDYTEIKDIFRPSHADFTYFHKYGEIPKGGGRASARETVLRVVAGSLAMMFLKEKGIEILAWVQQIGSIKSSIALEEIDAAKIAASAISFPDTENENMIFDYLALLNKEADSCGGIVGAKIKNVPIGLGEPIYQKLHAELGKAMLGINAAKGFEYGLGFEAACKKGSEYNDQISLDNKRKTVFLSNNDGGIQGGISNGQDIHFNVAFKAVPSIGKEQDSLTTNMEKTKLKIKGRHDVCFVPRVVPVVESMAALVIADFYLLSKKQSK